MLYKKVNKYSLLRLSFLLMVISPIFLKAQIVSIEPNQNQILSLEKKAKWFIDTIGNKTFAEIKNISFTSFDSIDFLSIDKNWTLWSKAEIVNNTGIDQEFLIQTNKKGVFEGYLYSSTDSIVHLTGGSVLKLNERSFASNTNSLKFLLKRNSKKIFVLKFNSVYGIYSHSKINVQIIKQSFFEKTDKQRLLWQGVFFGIILVMSLYNLFILFAVKDISYLYYVLSILSIGLYFVFYYGFGIEYVWPNYPIWDIYCFAIINPFTGLTRILFTRTYLHTPQNLPKLNVILNFLAVVCILTFFTGVCCYFFNIDFLNSLVIIIGALGTIILILMLVAGIVAYYYQKYDPAKYFIAANVLLVFGAIAFILRETGLINDSFLTRYLVQFGVVIQSVVLSLGLASRLNKMRLQLTFESLEKKRLALEKEKEKKDLIEKQKKELQKQIKEKTADLQHKNTLLELTIEKVKVSENKLSKLNQVKDKLFTVVSHDLRNPLATMQSFLKLITEHQDKMNEEEKNTLFIEAQHSLDKMNELLYNLLQWSKSQMNLIEFRPEKLSVKTLVESSVKLVTLNAHIKEIKIFISSEDGLMVEADKEMTEFILRNILSNAIKFSYRNNEVKINAYSSNGRVIIEITDNGIGMSENRMKKILEENNTTTKRGTEKEKGTGLGLLICKEFLEKNNGSLSIKSQLGVGSSFIIEMPKG